MGGEAVTHSIIPLVTLPRADRVGEQRVLARLQGPQGIQKELRWVASGAFWIAPRKRSPATLQLVTWNANGREVERTLSSGGRLSRGRLTQNLLYTTLMAEFGIVAAKTITRTLDLRYQTLLIDEAPP